MALNLSNAQVSDMSGVSAVTVASKTIDSAADQKVNFWNNSNYTKQWGYFNKIPDLKSALITKAIWTVGKGYDCDAETEVILRHISGWGKDTFKDILFNLCLCMRVFGDAFAEIIKADDKGETLINLKVLNPGLVQIVTDKKGLIIGYNYDKDMGKTENFTFKPSEIFHLSHNRFADQIHGISDIDCLEDTINAENESFTDLKLIAHHQAVPFILWKLKTDDTAKISAAIANIERARNYKGDLFIPDDDDTISHEVVEIKPSEFILAWRNDIRNKFYRALGLPLILFGQAGQSESGGKIEYFGHEQIWEHDQLFIEEQIWDQLTLEIDLIPPQTMLQNLSTDASKDAAQGMEVQQADITAGKGK